MKHTIDAKDKKLGRIASQAATLLMGKDSPEFARNELSDNHVEIINAAKADISDKKKKESFYKHFSGFAGGLREESMQRAIERKGISYVFETAIYGMLPKNKLRDQMIKHLKISE
jgi:large subunit ribosomal protein L13